MARGRPRKSGQREPNGRLLRPGAASVLPPAFTEPGLAVCADDYVPRDVTERGQVIGRTVQRKSVLDDWAGAFDGDQMRALLTYEARRDAVAAPGARCTLDRTPTAGGGVEAFHDALKRAAEAFREVNAALPTHLAGLLADLFSRRRDVRAADLPAMRAAADCLIVVLDRRRAA